MFRKVDCIRLRVPVLDSALAFYRDRLGHELVWRRGNHSAGLKMRDSDSELVLVDEELAGPEVDILVDSADTASQAFQEAGGSIDRDPFDIPVGRAAVVRDPWGNTLVLLDVRKGQLRTDGSGNVVE